MEQELLRQEVANLESSIEPSIVIRREQLQSKGVDSDSSATDVSDDEAGKEAELVDKGNDDLKMKLLERLKQRQLEESQQQQLQQDGAKVVVGEQSSDVTDEPKSGKTDEQAMEKPTEANDVNEKSVEKGEDEMNDEGGEERYVDMFAESGDEKEKTHDVKAEEVTQQNEDKEAAVPTAENDNKYSAETKEEELTEEFKVDTLKSLADLRNNMEEMSREQLEEALKNLPSKEAEDDGRVR